MVGMTYDDVQQHNAALVMKTLSVAVFVAPYTATAITSLTDTDKMLKALPDGYGDLGWLSDDGAQHSRNVDTSDITGAGSVEPLRSDVTSDVATLQVDALETNVNSIGLYVGQDMTLVTPNATSGEVMVSKPTRPAINYYRVLSLGVDLNESGEFYVARFFPRARVTDYDDQAYQSSDDSPLSWPVTLTGFTDPVLGTSQRYHFGGPGWFSKLADMGFDTGG